MTVNVTLTPFNAFLKNVLEGSVDLSGDTIKAMLVDASYTPNVDAHDFIDDVSGDEISGTGYSAGGFALAGKAVTQDNTADQAVWSANTISQAGCTFDFRYIVLYKDTGTPATSALIGYVDCAAQSLVGETFQVDLSALFTLGQ